VSKFLKFLKLLGRYEAAEFKELEHDLTRLAYIRCLNIEKVEQHFRDMFEIAGRSGATPSGSFDRIEIKILLAPGNAVPAIDLDPLATR
jgi:hypothetical protein